MNPTEHKSETPETDAVEWDFEVNCYDPDKTYVESDFARKLECERDQLRARVGELETKLTALGDLAVADWNDAIVGEVDKLIPSQTQKKYSEVLRDLFVTIPARAKELEKDKERLDWFGQNVSAISIKAVYFSFPGNLTIRQAIDAAMKCSQPTSEHLAATPNIAPNIPATNEEQE